MQHEQGVDIAVIILNWRTADLAAKCTETVLNSAVPNLRIATIVVDNASGDGSVELLRSKFHDSVEVIENATNNGYAGGMNTGLKRASELGARYAFLLNTDITVAPDTIASLYNAAEKLPNGAIFGPRLYDVGKPANRWFIAGRWDWGQGTITRVYGSSSDNLSNEPVSIQFVNGAAMFIRMKSLEDIGLFDERFGLYFEESDLCSRAARKGHMLYHVLQASVQHGVGASVSKAKTGTFNIGMYYRTRNRLLWGKKNLTGLYAASFWFHVAVRFPIKSVTTLLQRRTGETSAINAGIHDFALGRFGMKEPRPNRSADGNGT
jgi:GT2 family glycosyltransferase